MAAPRKRTTKRTTTSRRRTPAKSGRSSSSFVAMGIIAGLAIAILFYSIFIRQDANLSKGTTPQYAHTPNQTDVLNPLPPRPRQEPAPAVSQSQPPAPDPSDTRVNTPLSIAESTAKQNESQPATASTGATTQTKSPSAKPTPAPAKQTPPTPSMSEDAIGNLIAQNQTPALNQAKPSQSKDAVTPKDTADHVGALIHTMPSATVSDNADGTKRVTKEKIITKQSSTLNTVPEKAIALHPVPTKEKPFYLQTTFYKTEDEADAMRAQLLLLGHGTANVHKALVNNQTMYRVRIGPYTSRTELEKAQKNVEAAKLKLSPIH